MKHKHMFSLLDNSFTTVHVTFDNTVDDLPPGRYHMKVESIDYPGVASRDRARQSALHRLDRGSPEAEAMTLRMRFANEDAPGQRYIYKVPKTWNVEAGDALVVLNTNNQLRIVTVVKVDTAPDIDPDADFTYKWAVGKVDLHEYNDLVNKEKRFSDSMLEIERTKQRESLVNSFRDSLPEGSEARKLFEQTTASLSPPPPPPSAPEGGAQS